MYQELCHAVGNDQKYLASAFSNAQLMSSPVRQGKHIDANFDLEEQDVSLDSGKGRERENISFQGIANAVVGAATSNMNRKQSYVEIRQKRMVKRQVKRQGQIAFL